MGDEKEGVKKEAARIIDGSFDITANLPNSSQVIVHGYLYQNETRDQKNARLDEIADMVARQHARAGIELREAQIRQLTDNLKQIKKQIEDLSVMKREKGHLTSNQKQTLDNADRSIKSLTDQVNTAVEELAKVKKKVGWRD